MFWWAFLVPLCNLLFLYFLWCWGLNSGLVHARQAFYWAISPALWFLLWKIPSIIQSWENFTVKILHCKRRKDSFLCSLSNVWRHFGLSQLEGCYWNLLCKDNESWSCHSEDSPLKQRICWFKMLIGLLGMVATPIITAIPEAESGGSQIEVSISSSVRPWTTWQDNLKKLKGLGCG